MGSPRDAPATLLQRPLYQEVIVNIRQYIFVVQDAQSDTRPSAGIKAQKSSIEFFLLTFGFGRIRRLLHE
ncbi:MAG: hypothetical protein ACRD2G_02415 [Terriglobia bacterium]